MEILQDIEDFFPSPGFTLSTPKTACAQDVVSLRRKSMGIHPSVESPVATDRSNPGKSMEESFLPGTQSIWVRTFGCAHNQSDSEYMLGQLQDNGYK